MKKEKKMNWNAKVNKCIEILSKDTVLSDYAYSIGMGYEPVNATENEVNGMEESAEIPLGGMVSSDTTLAVDLGFGAVLPATVGVVNAIGILFYQEINGVFYELASDNALKLVFCRKENLGNGSSLI